MRSKGQQESCIAAASNVVTHMLAAKGSLAVEKKVAILASAEFTDNGSSARRGLGNKRKQRDRAVGVCSSRCYKKRIGRLGHQD